MAAALLTAGPALAQTYETGEGVSLPHGRLQLISGSGAAAFFIDLDRIERNGQSVTYWVFTAYVPGHKSGERTIVQETSRLTLDCDARTVRTHGVATYDDADAFVVGYHLDPEPEPVVARSSHEFQAKVLCDGVAVPAQNTFVGHAAALAVAREMLAGPPLRS